METNWSSEKWTSVPFYSLFKSERLAEKSGQWRYKDNKVSTRQACSFRPLLRKTVIFQVPAVVNNIQLREEMSGSSPVTFSPLRVIDHEGCLSLKPISRKWSLRRLSPSSPRPLVWMWCDWPRLGERWIWLDSHQEGEGRVGGRLGMRTEDKWMWRWVVLLQKTTTNKHKQQKCFSTIDLVRHLVTILS